MRGRQASVVVVQVCGVGPPREEWNPSPSFTAHRVSSSTQSTEQPTRVVQSRHFTSNAERMLRDDRRRSEAHATEAMITERAPQEASEAVSGWQARMREEYAAQLNIPLRHARVAQQRVRARE